MRGPSPASPPQQMLPMGRLQWWQRVTSSPSESSAASKAGIAFWGASKPKSFSSFSRITPAKIFSWPALNLEWIGKLLREKSVSPETLAVRELLYQARAASADASGSAVASSDSAVPAGAATRGAGAAASPTRSTAPSWRPCADTGRSSSKALPSGLKICNSSGRRYFFFNGSIFIRTAMPSVPAPTSICSNSPPGKRSWSTISRPSMAVIVGAA
mmetsp:Transcript_60879/g.130864  ORF Transcript_60879/g.130864 Transcript_60879/m.130864 type:complete len:215 (-) Transcript_60879:93-737(-)